MEALNTRASRFDADVTRGLGPFEFHHPPGTFALTPASRISLQAIWDHQPLLRGTGLDWGSGVGCLGIAAARIPAVDRVVGLELSEANVQVAVVNAARNDVAHKTSFLQADSYTPFVVEDRANLSAFAGQMGFILANPPSSDGDDGFEFRRVVLRGAKEFLAPGGVVFLSISYQYGARRIERLTEEINGFVHEGVLSSTDWVPFDLSRPDLLRCLENYAAEECRGGDPYAFLDPERPGGEPAMTAEAALACFRRTGLSPRSKWQTHLFRWQA